MNLNLKSHLLKLAKSKEVKGLVCDMVDNYVHHSDNNVDDTIARALRSALLPTQAELNPSVDA